ncbi:hypothetical protein [Flavobacterium sp. YO64]|nr:hypothetical protein [Flavobacterium sp. YO64]
MEKEKALAKLSIRLKPFIHKLIPPAKAGGNSKKATTNKHLTNFENLLG